MSDENIVKFPVAPDAKPAKKSNLPGLLSLAFGILSIIFFLMFINFFTAVIAIVLGAVQLSHHTKRAAAITGIAAAVISVVMSIAGWGIIFSNSHLSEATMEYFNSDGMDDYMRQIYELYGVDPDSML